MKSTCKPSVASLFALLGVAGLSACYAPSQDFPIGSPLWVKSNPALSSLEDARYRVPKKVTVAVLDGGIDYNHPRLRGHLVPFQTNEASGRSYGIGFDLLGGPLDFFPHYSVINPETGADGSEIMQVKEHGTHVSGLVTLGNPEVGLLPVRVLPLPEHPRPEETSQSDEMDALEAALSPEVKAGFYREAIVHVGKGVRLACRAGARILNLSLGIDYSELPDNLQAQVTQGLDADILHIIREDCQNSLLVVAAGNESREVSATAFSVPVTLDERNIVGVGALKSKKVASYYTNQGRYVDVFMRGSTINSSVPETSESSGARDRMSGTSMATPLVAHLAARILLILPELSPLELRALILNTATLEELEQESQPESDPSAGVQTTAPTRRLGLVANFATALRAAGELARTDRGSPEARRERLRLLTPPFDHGKSPF